MRPRYQPAELEIILDASRIARASIDSYSVRVAVGWRVPEATPPILATLDNLPAFMELVTLRCDDDEVELVPASWRRLHFGVERPSLFEMAWRTFGSLVLFRGCPSDRQYEI
jgi:hypothetical protein